MHKLLSIVLLLGTIAFSPSPCDASEKLFDRKTYSRHLQQGFRLLQAGKHTAAIIEFEKAVTVNPEAEAYYVSRPRQFPESETKQRPEGRAKSTAELSSRA